MKKILIVEDERALSSTLADNLISEGYTVVQTGDGEEGLQTALREKPDLILLDILMPKEDGLSMLTKLRADVWGKNVPVIIMSNLTESKNVADAMGSNVYEYLVKADWKIVDLLARIKERLK